MVILKPGILIGAIVGVLLSGVFLSKGDTATSGGPCNGQINIAAAQSSLNDAHRELGSAEHNGAWRVKALAATNTAIIQVNTGCNSPATAK